MKTTGLALLLLVAPLVAAVASGRSEQPAPGIVGSVVRHTAPAPDFALTDQHGRPFRLSEQRGKVVVLCFLSTHDTGVDPFVAVKVRKAYRQLGANATEAVFVAVTTDPARDLPEAMVAYGKTLGLDGVWHYVSGQPNEVHAVWARYAKGVAVDPQTGALAPAGGDSPETATLSRGLSGDDRALARQLAARFGGGYAVGHVNPLWIIDSMGAIQAVLPADANPLDMVTDVNTLSTYCKTVCSRQ